MFFPTCIAIFCLVLAFPNTDAVPVLEHSGIEEGVCLKPADRAYLPINFVNDNLPEDGFYLPFNNQLEARLIAEAILGRGLTEQDDMTKFCPRLYWNWDNNGRNIGEFTGFNGNKTSLTCQSLETSGENQRCLIKHENGFIGGGETFLTYTDSKSHFVVVICSGHNKRMFNVVSTKSKFSESEMAKLRKHVQQLGFDSSKFNTIDYSSC